MIQVFQCKKFLSEENCELREYLSFTALETDRSPYQRPSMAVPQQGREDKFECFSDQVGSTPCTSRNLGHGKVQDLFYIH